LEKFSPPDWLLKANLESGGPRAMFLPKKADWTKLFGIDIHSGPDVPSDLPDQFSISKISFISESNPILTFIALGGFGSYILIASLLLLFARRRISKDFASTKPSAPGNDEVKKTSLEKTTSETEVGIRLPLEDNCGGKPVASEPVPPYEPKTLISRFDEECKKIESYIGKNFTEPEMNLDMISRNTCVPSWRISEILRKKHDLSFPEYLNAIRIDQAKKYLLDNPDRPIIDIALSVGYGNPNNFDRVFKKLTDISPRLFREKNLPRKEA
jgi:AraC-like DNA-binding protein